MITANGPSTTQPHPDEARWMGYAMACIARRCGGRREDYQLEALLAVRRALRSTDDPGRYRGHVARACQWAALDVLRRVYATQRLDQRAMDDCRERGGGGRADRMDDRGDRGGDDGACPRAVRVASVASGEHPALLRYMTGELSDRVAASCLGITPGALRNRVHRIREKHRAA